MKYISWIISNKYTVIVLFFTVSVLTVLYIIRDQISFSLQIGGSAITVLSSIYQLVKTFRNNILFRKSTSLVEVGEGPKVLLWILDGCNVQAFREVAESNSDLKVLFTQGYFAQCVSIFPSITPAAHSSMMTGCYPAKTRIPAFDWVKINYSEELKREYIRCLPDTKHIQENLSKKEGRKRFYKELGDGLKLNQELLSPMVYTIFEVLGENKYTVSIKEWIHRGADNFFSLSANDVIEDLFNKKLIKQDSMIDLLQVLYREVSYEYKDLIWGSDSYKKLADLMVYWKISTDSISHEYGPRSPNVRKEIDEAIEKLAETIRFYKMYTNKPLYVIITADHSQSEIKKYSDLIIDFKSQMKEKSRYKIADRYDSANVNVINKADIIVANNDRAAFFYVFGKIEIRDVIINYLKNRNDVDLILYIEKGQKMVIQVLDGSVCVPELIEQFFQGKEQLYPKAIERIEGLMSEDNWGDVIISMKEDYTLSPDFKFDKEGIVHGDHGGLNYSDSIGPLLIWGPQVKSNNKDGNLETYKIIDIAPTIAEILNVQPVYIPKDGLAIPVLQHES